MRLQGQARMGYYPLPLREARRMRRFLDMPGAEFSILDPCAGCGTALCEISSLSKAVRYGIELDAYRAEQADKVLNHVIQGSCFDVHCPVESFSCLYLNAPYDWLTSDHSRSERAEAAFLEQCFRWLKPAGVLVMVVPLPRLGACNEVLAVHFRDKAIYRLTEPEAVQYQQIVVFGVRRSARERSQLKDWDVNQAKRKLFEMGRSSEQLRPLPDEPDRHYAVPASGPVPWIYRGIPLDAVEDTLPKSPAYRQASRTLFAPRNRAAGRPLTLLHSGHVGLVAVSGMLDGCLGAGPTRHVSAWLCVKVTDHFEEVEDGTTIIRERERFTHSLTLAFQDGRTAILTDGSKGAT